MIILYPINSKIPDTLREYSKKLEEITRILEELLPATRRINSSTFFECFSFVVYESVGAIFSSVANNSLFYFNFDCFLFLHVLS